MKFKSKVKDTVPVLAYHQISNAFSWSITRQTKNQFERCIRFLYDEGYTAISPSVTFDPDYNRDDKSVMLTFDDGYEDFYLNAFPVLKKYGFTACVFIITGYIGKQSEWDYNWGRFKKRHLNWDEIKDLSMAGFEIGSHTVNHPDLTNIPRQYLNYELRVSKETLEDKLGKRVDVLSYPFGRYNHLVKDEAERAGYKRAFTLSGNLIRKSYDSLSIPRMGIYLIDSPLSLKIKLDKSKLFGVEEMKGWIINRFPGWTIILKGTPDYENRKTAVSV
ncbi:MAG: polysaccharide deacetylase family protein [Candidatus Zixiibacteriota bacterium]